MEDSMKHAISEWRSADEIASDAEGLLRVQFLKYAEGITGPPTLSLLERTEELRYAANAAFRRALANLGL